MSKIDWALVGLGALLSLACATGGKDVKPHTVAVAMDTEEGRTCLRECQRGRNHCKSLCGTSDNDDTFRCEAKCGDAYEECKLTCPDACYQDDDLCNERLDARIEARKRAAGPTTPQPAGRTPSKAKNDPAPSATDPGYAPYPSL